MCRHFAKFLVFSVLNSVLLLGGAVTLVLMFTLWKGFFKQCPATAFVIAAIEGIIGFWMCMGLVGLLSIATRSKCGVYVYRFFISIAFLAGLGFIIAVLVLRTSTFFDTVLAASWKVGSDSTKCTFQTEFGCAGWDNGCYPGDNSISGCPSCTVYPSSSPQYYQFAIEEGDTTTTTTAMPTSSALVADSGDVSTTTEGGPLESTTKTSAPPTTHPPPPLPTCASKFNHIIQDNYYWALIGGGAMCVYILLLNVVSYFAAQKFTFIGIEDDERLLLEAERRVEERHERVAALQDTLQSDRAALDRTLYGSTASSTTNQQMESESKFRS